MNKAAILASLKDKLLMEPESAKVLVVGLGVTGLSVAHFLRDLGFQFAVTDSRKRPPLLDEFFQQIQNTPLFLGGFDGSAFNVSTHLIVSPGVSLNEKAIIRAVAAGVKIVSDVDLFVCSTAAPIVAITGSNGKSTVTTMVGDMAKVSGKKVGVGGNLGTPMLDLLAERAELYVLELSSFQLERSTLLNAAAATVLNVTADHLDRHENFNDYAREKERVFRGEGVMVINLDDATVRLMRKSDRRVLTFAIDQPADFYLEMKPDGEYLMYRGTEIMSSRELPVVGRHNAANALAALALGTAVGLEMAAMSSALKKFKGLAHRMQRVAEINGVTWVNDSKATNIGACIAALQGYDRKVVLIAGGDAKGADMAELVPAVTERTKGVVVMGKDAKLIEQALNGCVPVHYAVSMKDAVKKAASLADKGDSVLLSPACASLDQYRNYQDRGNKFIQAVMELAG